MNLPEPLAVWDPNSSGYYQGPWRERAKWVDCHLGESVYIYRCEFYLIDTAFAVVSRFVPGEHGVKWAQNGEPVSETAIVLLDGLPPANLIRST